MAWRYIAVGFRTDCFKLLSAFQASDCHSYKRFTEIWREMKFSYIYYERKSFCELLEFTEEVFMVCKEFLHPPNSLPFQIGSIYLLYGLYLKQPTRNHVKIRLTFSEWKLLNKVWNVTLSVNDLAVPLIISRLFLMNAFQFCFTERQMALEKKFRKYYEGGEKSLGEFLPMTVSPLMEQLDMQALENVCAIFYQYEEARNNLNMLLSEVKFKKHFSSDIISNLKTSALERIEKENRELNRYSELNGPTDSEDSVEELSEDAETGVPWWKCKKKMPWWKRCLPFGKKQTEKNKKREKVNSMEDSSELEEDVDNPDIIYLTEEASIHSEENNSTVKKNVTSDVPLLPCEDKNANLLSSNNRRRKSKWKQQTITNTSVPRGGNINVDIPDYSSSSVNKRRKGKCKQKAITTSNISDNSSLPTRDNISFDIPDYSSCSVKRRRKGKWNQQRITTNNISDSTALPTRGNICFDMSNYSSCPLNRRKESKWMQKTIKTNNISDNTSLRTEGNISFDVPSYSSCPVNRRRKGKWKQQTITDNISGNISLPTGGNISFDIPSCSSYPVNRRRKDKWKQQTITTSSTSDTTSLPTGGNISFGVPSYSSCPVNRRKGIKRRISAVTDNSFVSPEDNKSTATSPGNQRKTNKRKNVWAIRRYWKGKKSTTVTAVTTDNSLTPLIGDKNFGVSTHLTSSASKRRKITGKNSAETMNVVTNGSSVFRDSLSAFLPDWSSSQREAKKKITEKSSAERLNVTTNGSSLFRDSLSVFLPDRSLSLRETK